MNLIYSYNKKEQVLLSFKDLRIAVTAMLRFCRQKDLRPDWIVLPEDLGYQNSEKPFLLSECGDHKFILRKEN